MVSDESGTLNSTDQRVTETNNILTIDTSSSLYRDEYLRAESFLPNVFTVHKLQVTVCGNQVISQPTPFFISRVRTYNGSPNWITVSLTGVFQTQSANLPVNVCPVTNVILCNDNQCLTQPTEANGLYLVANGNSWDVVVDLEVGRDPT